MTKYLVILLSLILTPFSALADAVSVRDYIVRELREDGYSEIRISRTFLGRMRFLAIKSGTRREIVVTSNGEILRDYVFFVESGSDDSGSGGADDADGDDGSDDESDDSGSDNSGPGGGSDDSDDESSDNSGTGSSSSGRG